MKLVLRYDPRDYVIGAKKQMLLNLCGLCNFPGHPVLLGLTIVPSFFVFGKAKGLEQNWKILLACGCQPGGLFF